MDPILRMPPATASPSPIETVGLATGLSSAEARARLAQTGPNIIRRTRRLPAVLAFLARFTNPLVALLVASSVVLGATGDTTSMAIILVLVVASVALDFAQEYRAGRTIERLQATIAARARVRRDGAWSLVPVGELVPGDVVALAAGDVVPADGCVLETDGLFVDEAALTGESFPVERHAGVAAEAAGMATLRMGTAVVNGSGTMIVRITGAATALGDVAGLLAERSAEQPLERGTRQFGMLVLRVTLFLVLFVVLVNLTLHRPLLESFVFAVALAVGLTPELLPMIISVTLAHGARRLAAQHVIVKRLSAIYALGGMDVLCTDKTGTLTEATLRVADNVDAAGQPSPRALALARENSRLATGVRSPLDDALLAGAGDPTPGVLKLAEVPFDFERRRVSVLLARPDGTRELVVKGAPEDLLARCVASDDAAGTPAPLDATMRTALLARFEGYGAQGMRVLAVAHRPLPADRSSIGVADETDLVFAGFVTFLDPPRRDAMGVVAGLARAGIAVKIVTGDNERVTRHACAALGLPVRGVLTGADLDAMDDAALVAAAEAVDAFCRVSPAQKTRILRALRDRGHVVGFLGDGINDAPALHAADIGISVHGAAGVAREAAAVSLTRGRLAAVRDGVLEGRRTYANIMKYLMMATSSNFGNMLSMAAATAFLPFLPLLPVQILANNSARIPAGTSPSCSTARSAKSRRRCPRSARSGMAN